MTLYYSDDSVTLYHGDALEVLRGLPDGSVNCVVTSPPYYGLRDYGEPGQYGLEATPAEYVDTMRQVFAEARRVLTKDGTLWLNLGDSYVTGASGSRVASGLDGRSNRVTTPQGFGNKLGCGVPAKNLLGIPWRVAFALQDDGWILRNAIAWHKPNAMPDSVKDRLTTSYEHVFLLTRSTRYWFDLDPIREPLTRPDALAQGIVFGGTNGGEGKVGASARRGGAHRSVYGALVPGNDRPKNGGPGPHHDTANPRGRNPGDVWVISTAPFPEAHFAVFPPTLAERCIQAGCRPGGTVLDLFAGSGTTGMVALKHGRRFVGIDLSAKYLDLALRTRLAQDALVDQIEEGSA